MARSFLAWYRRYYLLVNLPLLFAITELIAVKLDLVRYKVNDLEVAESRLRAHPPGDLPVVLLLGNSGMRQSVDDDQLEQALGHVRVYNYGLSSARIDDTVESADWLIARGMRPKAIVIGLNPFLIDDHVNADSRFPWVHRTSPYLYFHRSILRGLIKKLFRGGMGNPDELGFVGTDGVPTEAQREFAVDAFLHEFEHRDLDDFPMIDEVATALAWFKAQKIPTYVVLLPISPDGAKRLGTFPQLIAALRHTTPVGSLDLVDRFPYTAFKDVGHVNSDGRKQVTALVASWLAANGVAR